MAVANSPEQFIVKSIIMTTDRFGDKEIDITNIVDTISVYENINMPYLTGNMLIFDDNDLYSKYNILGTERITFTFSAAIPEDKLYNEDIVKQFVITSVEAYKHNDSVSLLYCDLIEDHGYSNNLIKFSKSYTGTGEELIQKIVQDKLGLTVEQRFGDESDVFDTQAYQGVMKYIVPYISPLEACGVVVNRMCTASSFPFFLFSTMYSDNLILTDLGSIIRRDPFNINTPFVYSQGENINFGTNLSRESYVLNSYTSGANEDTLAIAQLGGIGSELILLELAKGEAGFKHVKITDAVQNIIDQSFINIDQRASILDDLFIPQQDFDVGGIDQYNSAVYVLPSTDPYRGVKSLAESQSIQESALRVQRRGMLALLSKNMYTVTGPGMVYTIKDINRSVGNQISINVLKNQMSGSSDDVTKTVDEKRSGNFVVTAKKYQFDIADQLCRYTLECARLTNRTELV